MDILVNNEITVHLKDTKILLNGVLVKFDDEFIYLQAERILIIPKENIRYYSLNNSQPQPEAETKIPLENSIRVFINGKSLTKIVVPPSMNLSNANEEVLRTIWANTDVQSALRGKIQKTLEYAPGEVNIILTDAEVLESQDETSFSMGGSGSPLSTYLSPSEMVSRLNNAAKKEKKNE